LQFFSFNMQVLAGQWLALTLTNSRTLLGTIGFVQGGVIVVTSPIAGVMVDRFSKRNLLIAGRSVMLAIVLVLAALVATDLARIWHLVVAALGMGLLMALMQPATQTYVFDIVGRERVQSAVALNSAGTGMAQMAGPALGGALIAVGGVTGAYLSTAAGLLVGVVALAMIPVLGRTTSARERSPWQDLREGFAYVRRTPAVLLVLIVCSLSVFNGTISVMRPVFARHVLDVGSVGLGIMGTTLGLGTVMGAVVLSALPPFRRPGLAIAASMGLYALCLFLYAFAFSFAYILVIEFLLGVASQAWNISTFSGLQTAVPEHIRGRVVSMVFMAVQLLFVGQLAIGVLADAVGDQLALGIFGLTPLLTILSLVALYHRTLSALSLC